MKWLGKKRFRFFHRCAGFSLLEVLVSVGILAGIGLAVVAALDTNARADKTLDEQVTGANLATAYIEAIRDTSFNAIYPNAGDNITVPTTYSVAIETYCSSDGENFVTCTGSANETFQLIRIIVSREGGKSVLSMCTYKYRYKN